MLSAKKIAKSYGDLKIFNDLNLQVQPGKIVFLLGPSGGGKSTLLRLMAWLEEPDKGTVELQINGKSYQSPSEQPESSPWPDITAVLQQLFLWPHLTLRENILLPLRTRQAPEERENNLAELVKSLDMDNFINRYPNQVSGGQRQRAALARALALQPKYILLDEPTSALDPKQTDNLHSMLLKLLKKGVGIIMITHTVGLIETFLKSGPGSYYLLANGSMLIQNSRDLGELKEEAVVEEVFAGLQA